jgi:drug/metabolite transporter (DMT)-like permease
MGFVAVPIVGVASSWLILGEPVTMLDLVGATTTLIGILVISVSTGEREQAEVPNVAVASATLER